MSEEPPGVIGSLPSTRPHRRSDRRAQSEPGTADVNAAGGVPPAQDATATAAGTPAAEPSPTSDHPGTVQTLVQAAAELTEIGLRATARGLRGVVSRLPKP